ncbi:intein-containing Rv2578c family radical SAM protein [Prauserella cavernicola]|uniref:Intein-containing Rv2578c family radical SAM protein n=1 Tax=Prauserella cavernicola TaxID=2800127 RepID=A0A934QX54_9PSEU|nr:intein-containing Rv2578c family radical SAM protein [Prauserella cavernicola]MBK1788103.1 intein-containing Rv2578c family radical SAM protein [Prauserella cavernicola]
MRWNGQRADGDAEQALLGLSGLIRSVRPPDFSGVTFHEVHARSVLNKVPDASRVPFRWTVNPYRGCSHACTYCLAGETPILLANGRTRPLAELRVGDEIYGTRLEGDYRRYVRTRVLAHWSTRKPAYRVTLQDGTRLVASGDHRFLSDRGWKYVTGAQHGAGRRPHLTTGNKLMGVGRFAAPPSWSPAYREGYLHGVGAGRNGVEGETLERVHRFTGEHGGSGELGSPADVAAPIAPDDDWQKGFLAGIFDAEGTHSRGILRIAVLAPDAVELARLALKRFGFTHVLEDPGRANGLRVVRLSGGLTERLRFFHTTDPATTHKRTIDGVAIKSAARLGVVAVEPLGEQRPLFDITTATGDFIADGVVSHNCFARNTHTYLDLDAGHDFDTQVVVKVNAAEVLGAQVRRRSWRREHVAMGTNTDPYQRAEGKYELMPGIIRALAGSGTPFSILSKGTVLARDLPLLSEVGRDVPVGLGVSIALLDRDLQRRLEPGTPSPRARLELVRKAREAGLPCVVFLAPVLPGLTDSVEALDGLLAEVADAGATGVTVIPLHLRPGAREWFAAWLAEQYPDLVPRYQRLYARGSYVDAQYRRWLSARVTPLLRRHGLGPRTGGDERGVPGDREVGWPEGSMPGAATEPDRVRGDQLTLL